MLLLKKTARCCSNQSNQCCSCQSRSFICWVIILGFENGSTRWQNSGQNQQSIQWIQWKDSWNNSVKFVRTALQTYHVYSTLKQHGNDCFHVVLTWNTRGVFVGWQSSWFFCWSSAFTGLQIRWKLETYIDVIIYCQCIVACFFDVTVFSLLC